MNSANDPKNNGLLSALSEESYLTLLPDLEYVDLPMGRVIYESGDKINHVYFPTNGFISKLNMTEAGNSIETATTGYEGVVSTALFMGGDTTPSKSIVASKGDGYRLKAEIAKSEFNKGGSFQDLVLRYIQALACEMSQNAVCKRHHAIEHQFCRWLLACLDRIKTNEICMTQQLIANALGVRREGVAEAAGKLQKLGVIKYSRGKIALLHRQELENRVCECYAVVHQEYARLLPYFRE